MTISLIPELAEASIDSLLILDRDFTEKIGFFNTYWANSIFFSFSVRRLIFVE